MEKIKCPECGFETKYNMIKKHLERIHEYSTKDAIVYKIKEKNKDISFEKIREEFEDFEMSLNDIAINNKISRSDVSQIIEEVLGLKVRNLSQSKKAKHYTKKYKETIKEKYGVDNVSQIEEVKAKKIETMVKNYRRVNNFCDKNIRETARENLEEKFKDISFVEKIKEKQVKTARERYGVDNVSQIQEVREVISKKAKERMFVLTPEERKVATKKAREVLLKNGSVSKMEDYISSILNDYYIYHERNKEVNGFFVDIYIEVKNRKIIIEAQGDFWHLNPKKYNSEDINAVTKKTAKEIWARDIERSYKLSLSNHEVYWLWEKDKNIFEEKIIKIINKEEDEWNRTSLQKEF